MIEIEFILRFVTLLTQIIVIVLCIQLCLDYKERADEIDKINDRLEKLETEIKPEENEMENNHEQ